MRLGERSTRVLLEPREVVGAMTPREPTVFGIGRNTVHYRLLPPGRYALHVEVAGRPRETREVVIGSDVRTEVRRAR